MQGHLPLLRGVPFGVHVVGLGVPVVLWNAVQQWACFPRGELGKNRGWSMGAILRCLGFLEAFMAAETCFHCGVQDLSFDRLE